MSQLRFRSDGRPARRASAFYEADVLEGLEPFAHQELAALPGVADLATRPGAATWSYDGPPAALHGLRSVVAVLRVLFFAVPRPKALLGHQHFEAIVAAIEQARQHWPDSAFATLRLSAAGAESAVLARLAEELSARTGLRLAEDADMLLRLRRAADGWHMLIRLSPRPLATRPWRVHNLPGAMNATVAHAMMGLTDPRPTDAVLNLGCGSATLMIERLALGPARSMIGCDTDSRALLAAQENLVASGTVRQVQLERWDATKLPLPDASIDVLCADLPFGQVVGSHRINQVLYPRLLGEATRVAAPKARMVLLTHEITLLEHAMATYVSGWKLEQAIRVRVGGMAPRIFLFRRTAV